MRLKVLLGASLLVIVAGACGSPGSSNVVTPDSGALVSSEGGAADGGPLPHPNPPPDGGDAGPFVEGGTFTERFDWKGAHAATVDGTTTVWWNGDAWDVRGDSDWMSTLVSSGATTGFAIDVRKAQSSDPTVGQRDATAHVVGGDGSRGVGVMRLDEQDIASARLRNPMIISAAKPAVVSFYASRFVTTGHWWEVAITPASRIVGAEFTPVPGNAGNCEPMTSECNDGLTGPATADDNTPGPGHRPAEESINVITTGWPDIPTCSGFPFYFRSGVKAQIGTGPSKNVVNYVDIFNDPNALPVTKPDEIDQLYAWRIEYRPDGIDLYADFNRDGSFVYHQHYAIAIPWSEVHVHLMGLAYQADHHPQKGCGYQGTTREIVWRDVTVSPVKYARTSVAPKEGAARTDGWMYYDLRNSQLFGPPVDGAPQPNDATYSLAESYLFGSVPNTPRPMVNTQTLTVDLADDQAHAAAARLLYDVEGTGTATLEINGTSVGAMPPATSAPAAGSNGESPTTSDFRAMWVRRGVDVPAGVLVAGKNTFKVTMNGAVVMDRLQLEFGHTSP